MNTIHTLRFRIALTLLIGVLVVPGVLAQSALPGVSLVGVGGGGPAFARDNDALFLNPANLVLSDRGSHAVLSLGSTSAFAGGDLFQFNFYNDFFASGRHLSDDDITTVLDGWFGQDGTERRAGLYAEVIPLALTVRGTNWAMGFGVRARAYNSVGVNRGWLDLLLRGTSENRSIPITGSFRSLVTTDISVAYSRRFSRMVIGVAPKLVLGRSLSDGVFTSTAHVSDEALSHDFDYTVKSAGVFSRDFVDAFNLFNDDPFADVNFSNPFGAVSGKGLGLDLGLTYLATPGFLMAFSLTDLGSISWDGDAQVVRPTHNTFSFGGLVFDQDRIDNEFDGAFDQYAESVLDSLAHDAYDSVVRERGGFSTSLPSKLHLGGAWYAGRATLSFGFTKPLNDAPGNLSLVPYYNAGMEYRLGPFPLRAGVRYGGDGALMVAGGIGLRTRVYEFGIALSASPQSDLMGNGGRYALSVSMINIHI